MLGIGTFVPAFMLAIGLVIGIENLPKFYVQLGYLSAFFFSAKSVNCSVAILWATTTYRYVKKQLLVNS